MIIAFPIGDGFGGHQFVGPDGLHGKAGQGVLLLIQHTVVVRVVKQLALDGGGQRDTGLELGAHTRLKRVGDGQHGGGGILVEAVAAFIASDAEYLAVGQREGKLQLTRAQQRDPCHALRVGYSCGDLLAIGRDHQLCPGEGGLALILLAVDVAVVEGEHLQGGGGDGADAAEIAVLFGLHTHLGGLCTAVIGAEDGIALANGEHHGVGQRGGQLIFARLQGGEGKATVGCGHGVTLHAHATVGKGQHQAAQPHLVRIPQAVEVGITPRLAVAGAGQRAANAHADAAARGQHKGLGAAVIALAGHDGVIKQADLGAQGPNDVAARHGGRQHIVARGQVGDVDEAFLVGFAAGGEVIGAIQLKQYLNHHAAQQRLAAEPAAVEVVIAKGDGAHKAAVLGWHHAHRQAQRTALLDGEGGRAGAGIVAGEQFVAALHIPRGDEPLGQHRFDIVFASPHMVEGVAAISRADRGIDLLLPLGAQAHQGQLGFSQPGFVRVHVAAQILIGINGARDRSTRCCGQRGQMNAEHHCDKQVYQCVAAWQHGDLPVVFR